MTPLADRPFLRHRRSGILHILVLLYYVYGLIEGEWRPIDEKWLPLDEARTSTYLAIQRGATMIGMYTWDGATMTWSTTFS